MASSKKKLEEAKSRRRLARQARKRRQVRSITVSKSFGGIDIQREIEHITELAQAGEARIVTQGAFVLFSTDTRDAWLLDREDQFAACVCWEGETRAVKIIDTPTTFGIDWTAKFEIEGAVFRVYERTGRTFEVEGYPTNEISKACRA